MQRKMLPEISIVLVNYKNVQLTDDCINSIFKSNITVPYEIIVIDNHSEDDSVNLLTKKYPGIIVHDSGRNGGFAFGNNKGVKLARGKYVLLLNNDTVVKSGMIDELYQFAEQNPSVGILGCNAVDREGVMLPVAHQYESLKRIRMQLYLKPILEKVGLQRKLVSFFEHKKTIKEAFTSAEWIAGSAMFMRRELYNQVGGLDENFFMYMEDEDLCRRVKQMGYQVGIIPYVGYIHYCGGSTIVSYALTKEYIKSRLIFFKRYEKKHFEKIKKALYHQISTVNRSASSKEISRMRLELDEFIIKDLDGLSSHVNMHREMK